MTYLTSKMHLTPFRKSSDQPLIPSPCSMMRMLWKMLSAMSNPLDYLIRCSNY